MGTVPQKRRLPIGAEPTAGGGTHFRVWAPRAQAVEVVLETIDGDPLATADLTREAGGYFAGTLESAGPGSLYRYRLDHRSDLLPDPASRFQPLGPHGPSQVIDPSAFAWSDHTWRGVTMPRQILYELHIGTFTPEGTWAAAANELPRLSELGITAIEVMPVADFPGRFGWGYDGVNLFAPTRLYGNPDDFRAFVNTAHHLGIGVILDVVYNHLGPDGNYLADFAPEYFTDRYPNEWGDAVNFDGPGSAGVREFVLANARYWIEEFHLDGLRLDATQQMYDASADHIVGAITRAVRDAASGKETIVIAENEPQNVDYLRDPEAGGLGLDALWNDDFHHTFVVALTRRREAYFTDYRGTPQELVSAVKRGFLYQGQYYSWQGVRRGSLTRGIPRHALIAYIENHDQVANSATGTRLWQRASPARFRAITALFLLAPATPMLFQGQEYGSTRPFLYFADHVPGLSEAVRRGRAEFLRQFPNIRDPEVTRRLPDPGDPRTFEASRLDPADRERNPEIFALHRDLLRIRREDPVISRQAQDGIDGAVLTDSAFVIRYFAPDCSDRLLLVNLGTSMCLEIAPEPLLGPPGGMEWAVVWSSEDLRYGGGGISPVETPDGWHLAGESAVVLAPKNRKIEERKNQERTGG